ncbi:MAG: hypothetical protein ABIQ40_03370 [Bacteroidia bacterium]
MNLFIQKNTELHPESIVELQYWSNKWGISIRQLNEAIVDTGSTNIPYLRTHLIKNNIVHVPFLGWIRNFTNKFNSIKLIGH